MATIKDVAKRAGVSIASVSRYFNNKALLSADKCAAIENAVQELSYSPQLFRQRASSFAVREGVGAAAHDVQSHLPEGAFFYRGGKRALRHYRADMRDQ